MIALVHAAVRHDPMLVDSVRGRRTTVDRAVAQRDVAGDRLVED